MKLDKKQLPQFIVLGVLVMICIGYVSFTVMSPSKSQPPTVSKQKAETNDSVASDEVRDAADNLSEDVSSEVFPDLTTSLSRRDPFAPQTLPPDSAVQVAKSITVRPVTARPSRMFRPVAGFGSVPKIDLKAINPFNQPNVQVAVNSDTQQTQPEPQFTLTGVIRGDENVAIIRSSSGGRHVVREGQLIDGKYRVQSVSGDGVVLVSPYRRIHVKLGGV